MSKTTIFEQIAEETKGKSYSANWYRKKVRSMASKYTLKKVMRQEKVETALKDKLQDDNELRNETRVGHLYLFEYKATSKRIPFYDKFPLVYVLSREGDHFYGVNLHYMSPKARLKIVKDIKDKKYVNVPQKIIHKYLYSGVKKTRFLDLGQEEWETAIFLPIEDFVYERGGRTFSYNKNDVWQLTYKSRMTRFKERRIVEAYPNETKK